MNCRTFLLALGLVSTLGCPLVVAAEPSTNRFFGLTNLWTIRLTFAAKDWDAMEPAVPEGRRRLPGGPRTPEMGGPGSGERQEASPRQRPAETGPVPMRPAGQGGPRPRNAPMETDYPWSTCTFECAGQTWTNVAVRFKGNSSFWSSQASFKRPFKLDFDRQSKGRTFEGLEELFLNNNFNDPTQMREVLAYDLFRAAGLPASRTAYAKVWLTIAGRFERRYLGLYTLVEPVEGDFLKQHFGSKKGLLAKPEGVRGLEYLGDAWPAYVAPYQAKTSPRETEAHRLIALTRFVEQADDATFAAKLGSYADVGPMLRFLALNSLLANMDSFIGNGHNYYLYIDPTAGLAHFVPWDLNEAFGRHPVAGPPATQMNLSIRRPQSFPNRLVERVVADPVLQKAYLAQCSDLTEKLFTTDRLRAQMATIAQVTQTAIADESPRAKTGFERLALGMTNTPLADLQPLGGADGAPPSRQREFGGEPPGLRERDRLDIPLGDWIAGRVASVKDQLAGRSEGVVPRYTRPGGPGAPGGFGGPGGSGRDRRPEASEP